MLGMMGDSNPKKGALEALLKIVRNKMGAPEEGSPEEEAGEPKAEAMLEDKAGEKPVDAMLGKSMGDEGEEGKEEEPNSGEGPSPEILKDMERLFGGKAPDDGLPPKKGLRVGMTEISAIPLKKPPFKK